jgi:hypothetical protein
MNNFNRFLVSISIIFIIGFIYFFFAYDSFYGEVQFTELIHTDNEYKIVAKSLNNDGDIVFKIAPANNLEIVIDKKYSKNSIGAIWDELNENQSYHVYYRSYLYREKFILDKIYLD